MLRIAVAVGSLRVVYVVEKRNSCAVKRLGCEGVHLEDRRLILLHVRHHLRSAGSEKSDEKKRSNGQKNDVQNSRVIETDRCFDDLSAALRRDQSQRLEKEFNQERCEDHGDIKDADNEASDFPPVILSINVYNREHEEVGINERDDAAEADAAVPKHCSQRNVAHGTNERKDSDDRSDDWSPKLCGDWMRNQEEFLPKIRRYPRSQCSCDQQPAGDIFPNCRPIHDEIMTDGSKTVLRGDALPTRAFGHAHVHFRMTLHLAFESLVRLCPRFSN